MFNLKVIDVSATVYQGVASEKFKNLSQYGYPVGGIHSLMRYVVPAIMDKDDIVLAFDSKRNFRKDILEEYKSGRVPNKSVISQLDTLYEELSGCGFNCYKFEGYEGDDIISWACTQYQSAYDEVIIIGNDRDLLHNIRGNIRFRSITPTVNNVCQSDFEYSADKKERIPFNTISVNKVLCGCTSDKIPPYVTVNGIKGVELYNVYLQALNQLELSGRYEYTTSIELLLKILLQVNAITESDVEALKMRAKVVFPANCPEDVVIIPTTAKDINRDNFAYFLAKYNDWQSIKNLGYYKMPIQEDDIKALREKGYALSSGAIAVDKNLQVHDVDTLGECMFMRDFD